jgi:bifunctional non-homologous end joining protein LigD
MRSAKNRVAVSGAPEPFPTKLSPMLAQLADAPFRDPAWLFEPKLDGYRMLVFLRAGEVTLVSRRGLAYTGLFPSLVAELRAMAEQDCVLDGEIIALDARGRPSFNALQNRAGLSTSSEIAAAEARTPAIFFCFDCLHHAGRNLRGLGYIERRTLLSDIVQASTHIQLVHADENGVALYEAAVESGFEGVVAKRKSSIYRPGQRSADWLKVKHTLAAEFVIGGYSKGQGQRDRFGSLVVGYWDEAGELRYAANVGTGFDEATIDELMARFQPLQLSRSPFAEKVPVRAGTVWLEPRLVAEVTFAHWTEGAHLRAPVFLRLRDDVDAASVRRVDDVKPPVATGPRTVATKSVGGRSRPKRGPVAFDSWPEALPTTGEVRQLLAALDAAPSTLDVRGHVVKLTHLDRVYWPAEPAFDQGPVTKLDLIRYFIKMAPMMLPHLADRPLTLFRWPGGIRGRRMLQKHPPEALPGFVERVTIFSETKGADDEYMLCNNLATLVWLAEVGALEIHAWHSRCNRVDMPGASAVASGSAAHLANSAVNFPDYLLFDIDPYIYSGQEGQGDEPAPNADAFEKAKEVAMWLKAILDDRALESFVKTSGKTGLHVVVPIARTLRYDVVRPLAGVISKHLQARHPTVITTEWDTTKRTGKIFLDFNMNVRGKSIIAPYAPRGLAGAPVSMPLSWRQLAQAQPGEFRIPTLVSRRASADPWSNVLVAKQDLAAALSRQ